MTNGPKGKFWKRVVIKLSGEALMGEAGGGLEAQTLERIAGDLVSAAQLGIEIAIVVGGGNFFRGVQGAGKGIERARADSIGMLATVMNGLALEQAIEAQGRSARALSAIPMPSICANPIRGARRCIISPRAASSSVPAAPAILFSPPTPAPPCAPRNFPPTRC